MPSTAIREISHDPVTDTLFVTFVDGDTYAYFGVPVSVFQAFRAARSRGGFFARAVRGRYRYQKLDRPAEGEPAPSPATLPSSKVTRSWS